MNLALKYQVSSEFHTGDISAESFLSLMYSGNVFPGVLEASRQWGSLVKLKMQTVLGMRVKKGKKNEIPETRHRWQGVSQRHIAYSIIITYFTSQSWKKIVVSLMTEKLTLKKKLNQTSTHLKHFHRYWKRKMALREDALCWRDSKLVCAHHVRMKTWVCIPRTHIQRQAQTHAPLNPALERQSWKVTGAFWPVILARLLSPNLLRLSLKN